MIREMKMRTKEFHTDTRLIQVDQETTRVSSTEITSWSEAAHISPHAVSFTRLYLLFASRGEEILEKYYKISSG